MVKKKYLIVLFFGLMGILLFSRKSEAASVLWPIGGDNASDTYIEYGYGVRQYQSQSYIDKCKNQYGINVTEGYYNCKENHYGVDIFGIPGKTYSVVAVANGTVVGTSANYANSYAASTNYIDRNQRRTYYGLVNGGGYGNFIVIQDSSTGKCYLYGHLKAGTFRVKKGDKVTAGQEIAKMGSSGDSGHMHLHFEVRKSLNNTFTSPNTTYTYFTVTTGYNIQTENPVNYIGNSVRTPFNDGKVLQPDHDEMVLYIKYLYRAALGREASEAEAQNWANSYDKDKSLSRITNGIVLSREGLNHMGSLDNTQYIKYIYKILLLRATEPTDSEISGHLSRLNTCRWNRQDFITMICNCNEFSKYRYNTIVTKEKQKQELANVRILPIAEEGKLSMVGDLNADGRIDASDASTVLALYAANDATLEYYSYARKYADVNEDGKITCVDATFILSYYSSLSVGKIKSIEETPITEYVKNRASYID